MKKLLSLFIITTFLLNTTKKVLAEEKHNFIDLGVSFIGLNLKYANDKTLTNKDIFGRFGYGYIGTANVAFGFDLEIGINDYFIVEKDLEKEKKGGYYFKYFGGTSFALSPNVIYSSTGDRLKENTILPFVGVGIGAGGVYQWLGLSAELDLITTLKSSEKNYLEGLFFLRPSLNLKYAF